MDSDYKTCSRCKQVLPRTLFNRDRRRKDGLTYHCKTCVSYYSSRVSKEIRNKQAAKWKKDNPEKVRAMWIKQLYGLSWENYLELFAEQRGLCKICGKALKLHKGILEDSEVACVDHCHTTLQIRGLLCSKCNAVIGLMNEDPELLLNAIKYLEGDIMESMTKDEYIKQLKSVKGVA